MNSIRLSNIEKSYNNRKVLEIDSFTASSNEKVIIRGGNGSGKSTFLKVVSGIIQPTSGTVNFGNELKKYIKAYVPQNGGFYKDLSLLSNIRLRNQLFGVKKTKKDTIRLIDSLGMTPYMNIKISEMSGGFQRLSCIVVALQTNANLLFIDEPFTGIDSENKNKLMEILCSISDLKILIITSPIEERFPIGFKEYRIKNGRFS